MSDHTPTPWIIRAQVQQGKNKGGFYLAPDETCSAPAWGSNRANAEFIVKAVNSYDDLLKANQLLHSLITNRDTEIEELKRHVG